MMNDDAEHRLRLCTTRLRAIAIGSARLEAKILIDHAGSNEAVLEKLINRRLKGEPVDRIVGMRGFWTLDLLVTPDVLSPRPDTETIVSLALELVHERMARNGPLQILDLGTGSGAILLSLLKELPEARGIGLDISPAALAVAKRNAEMNGLADRASFVVGDWKQSFSNRFDLVVSNPPYIPTRDLATLETEVIDHDPIIALDGGADGLDPYRIIFEQLQHLLKPEGIAVFEFGYGQSQSIQLLMNEYKLYKIQIKSDIAAIPRALALSFPF